MKTVRTVVKRLLEKLTVAELVKKFPAIYTTNVPKSLPLVPVLNQLNAVHIHKPYFFNVS
jgi:hypothetical protein